MTKYISEAPYIVEPSTNYETAVSALLERYEGDTMVGVLTARLADITAGAPMVNMVPAAYAELVKSEVTYITRKDILLEALDNVCLGGTPSETLSRIFACGCYLNADIELDLRILTELPFKSNGVDKIMRLLDIKLKLFLLELADRNNLPNYLQCLDYLE